MSGNQPAVRIEQGASGLVAVWPVAEFRFLLDDGRTVDVTAHRDDSDLRAAVLAHTKANRIEGVARLSPDEGRLL